VVCQLCRQVTHNPVYYTFSPVGAACAPAVFPYGRAFPVSQTPCRTLLHASLPHVNAYPCIRCCGTQPHCARAHRACSGPLLVPRAFSQNKDFPSLPPISPLTFHIFRVPACFFRSFLHIVMQFVNSARKMPPFLTVKSVASCAQIVYNKGWLIGCSAEPLSACSAPSGCAYACR